MNRINRILFGIVFLFVAVSSSAQEGGAYGSFSPYSLYGVGELSTGGSAFTRSMGGVGVATRNKRFINIQNPAAVTARDSLSFMADLGISQSNNIYSQKINGNLVKSGYNTFNIHDFVMSFPIYRSSAFMVGITPFSDVGYSYNSYVDDKDIIGNTGNISYNSYGEGSIYQLFAAAGVTLWKKLSLGVQANYYFGAIDKVTNQVFATSSYRSINSGSDMYLTGVTGKFGLQYEQKIGKDISMILGATYRMKTNVKGYYNNYRYATASSVVDTLVNTNDTLGVNGMNIAFGDEFAVGIAVKGGDMWSAEFNFAMSGWDKSNFDNIYGLGVTALNSKFTAVGTKSYRAGFEITPNRNDVRYYFKQCTYRVGFYHEDMYYKLDGNQVKATGITLGITLPVYKLYNGITLGVDIGQRGNLKNLADPNRTMIKENYFKFNIGLNIHDLWFQKTMYN